MPKFYFHVDGVQDPEGIELSGLAEAKCEAVRYAGRLICDSAGDFWNAADWNMKVSDENGLDLFALHFAGVEAPAIRSR
jgi:hypothetical protein